MRPALLSVVALMFLLLPFLLLTTSVQKLVGLDLHVPPAASEIPPDPPGTVEDLRVRVQGKSIVVSAKVRKTDVGASAGDVEERIVEVPATAEGLDLAGLQGALRVFKRLDPERAKVLLEPDDAVPGKDVVFLMDAVRADADGELFGEVALGSIAPETAATLETPE
ncbi:MAG: hypothetical protein GY913_18365 [Proteobacteria bacterium]|nr:hypothetical protein [Pseudomonadota bacterium]MCP4918874.1 hypothetical protein [Pseudomonadota bacterium]